MVGNCCCLLSLLLTVSSVIGNSLHDCWDPEKLQRMTFTNNENAADPGLSQFAKMVKCLAGQQGKGGSGGSTLDTEWNQWTNLAGGQFMPPWNNDQRNRQQQPQPNGNNNNWAPGPPNMNTPGNTNWAPSAPGPPNMNAPGLQPEPGVHPDDWGRVRTSDPIDSQWPNNNNNRGGGGIDQQQQPTYKDRKRNRELRKQQQQQPDLDDQLRRRQQHQQPLPGDNLGPGGVGGVGPGSEQRFDQSTWNNPNPPAPNPIDEMPKSMIDYTLMNQEETSAVWHSRKYGYVIMALSVVVLAVLMVTTIFCCNNSNSTMAQAATHNIPANQFDTYSMYSYKGGVGGGVGADTLRSTGTLGGMSMHTETMKSRGSPQYRVSDIDPDFARRFKENQQY